MDSFCGSAAAVPRIYVGQGALPIRHLKINGEYHKNYKEAVTYTLSRMDAEKARSAAPPLFPN
jgi:hypothetical protein